MGLPATNPVAYVIEVPPPPPPVLTQSSHPPVLIPPEPPPPPITVTLQAITPAGTVKVPDPVDEVEMLAIV
jgi:hypothetical protein